MLKNQRKHTQLLDQIRRKMIEMEQQEWKVSFRWIKTHARQRGNELADQLSKEAASNKKVNECYNRFPKTEVISGLKEQSLN